MVNMAEHASESLKLVERNYNLAPTHRRISEIVGDTKLSAAGCT